MEGLSRYRALLGMMIALTAIYWIGWVMQAHLLLNWDIGYFIHTVTKLFTSQSYTHDYFEPNLPLSFYFCWPPLFVATRFDINVIPVFRLYIFLLGTLSLCSSYQLLHNIIPKQHRFFQSIMLLTLAATYFILPVYDFGQREHLLWMLAMPYLLLTVCRLQRLPVNSYYAFGIGVAAGLGFALKPFFVITPLLLEIYYLMTHKKILGWLRPEVMAVLLVLVSYLSSIFIFYPDYVTTVLPFTLRLYHSSLGKQYAELMMQPIVFYTAIAAWFCLLQCNNPFYKHFNRIFLLASIGFLFSYVSSKTGYYYHLIPLFSIGLLLFVLACGQLLQRPRLTILDYFAVTSSLGLLLIFHGYYLPNLWAILALYPYYFFGYFAIIFSLLLYVFQKKILNVLMAITIIIGLSGWCYYISERMPWLNYTFYITLIMLFSLFSVFSLKCDNSFKHKFIATIVSVFIPIYPLCQLNTLYQRHVYYKQSLQPLFAFLQQHAHHRTLYFFSTKSYNTVVDHANVNATYVQRFPVLWMIRGFLAAEQQPLTPLQSQQLLRDKQFVLDGIIGDLQTNKPDYIFVDTSRYKHGLKTTPFDYLDYFSQSRSFRNAWQHYRYIKTIYLTPNQPSSMTPKLDVYQRFDV